MFEIKHLKGNTYYFEAYSNVGIYDCGDGRAILIDAGDHPRMVKGLNGLLAEKGLRVAKVIDTHCHVDHICGNAFFAREHGAELLCSEGEQLFIAAPDLEPKFYFCGIDTDKSKNQFFKIEPSYAEVITDDNIPEGFEIISLPGHSFDMIGVCTPDNVLFLADAVLAEKTWREYKLPFFYSVNEAIGTLEKIKTMQADIFVPSHNEPVMDIKPLADINIEGLTALKRAVLDCCEGRSFDGIFAALAEKIGLDVRTTKYPMYAVMVRNVLQALVEEEKLCGIFEEGYLLYRRK